MSFLDSRNRGLPYGAIPYQELLSKLEETDTNEEPEDIETKYDNYMRSEIVDRSLETPYLESDKTRRDSSLSKSIINLRYNGARGEYEHPQHPELFCGFMDQDNRALDNNPRMDQYQQQISTRMPNLEKRMGYNCTDNDHQSPWTNHSLDQCRRDIQTSLAYNTKVFTDERDGRALNRNFVVEYDHNKKPLIYKDVLPFGTNSETQTGKNNTQYTTSAVPFVSTDTEFTPSYKNINNYCAGIMPGTMSCQRHITNDQKHNDHLDTQKSNMYAMQYGSKTKNNNTDQVYNEQLNNYTVHNNGLVSRYTAHSTDANIRPSDIEHIEPINVKTPLINPITNAQLLNNDILFSEFMHSNAQRNDMMRRNNTGTLMNVDIRTNDVDNYQRNPDKHVMIKHINNNVLINSSYYIPEFTFREPDTAKNTNKLNNNVSSVNKTMYNKLDDQTETQTRATAYKFSDMNVMDNTIVTVPDNTNETPIRTGLYPTQERKVQSINSEEVWAQSDENTSGKTQKQEHTGGIKPSVMEVPDSHDIESHNGGAIMGRKLIRNDKLQQDNSIMSEDITAYN